MIKEMLEMLIAIKGMHPTHQLDKTDPIVYKLTYIMNKYNKKSTRYISTYQYLT